MKRRAVFLGLTFSPSVPGLFNYQPVFHAAPPGLFFLMTALNERLEPGQERQHPRRPLSSWGKRPISPFFFFTQFGLPAAWRGFPWHRLGWKDRRMDGRMEGRTDRRAGPRLSLLAPFALASPIEVILLPKSGFRGPNFRDGAGGKGAGSGPELAPHPVTHREARIRPSLMITLIEPPLEMQQKGWKGVAVGCQGAETCRFHPKTSSGRSSGMGTVGWGPGKSSRVGPW